MRTVEAILADYEEARKHDEMQLAPGYARVYQYANTDLRNSLREEYIGTLPANKQLAIRMHNKLCHCNHTDQCSFFYEIDGIVDDWSRYTHKHYLEKADKAIKAVSETAHNEVVKMKAPEIVTAVLNSI